ncbi:MAG: hypothetical protein ACRDVP_07805 [Acidimicrobiales bacterium]
MLTPALQKRICDSIATGNWLSTAAQAAGVTPESISHWKLKGGEDLEAGRCGSIYAKFVQAIARAEAGAEITSLGCIQRAARRDWRAAAWLAERRFPTRWAPSQTVAEEYGSGGVLDAEFVLSDEAFDIVPRLLEGLAQKTTQMLAAPREATDRGG